MSVAIVPEGQLNARDGDLLGGDAGPSLDIARDVELGALSYSEQIETQRGNPHSEGLLLSTSQPAGLCSMISFTGTLTDCDDWVVEITPHPRPELHSEYHDPP